jgi:limonene-1,2-epoxide hydrolase
VHIFGNRPSPAIAIFGLRHATKRLAANCSTVARNFIRRNFYVDDGLGCADTPSEAVQILKEPRTILAHYNIHLHKIAASSSEVLAEFPESEKA